jgi:HK97 gp10 family phage protein
MARAKLLGVAALRRKIEALDPSIRSRLSFGIDEAGHEILDDMKSNVAVAATAYAGRGHLRDALSIDFRPDLLSAKVGLVEEHQKRLHYYWMFIEAGTRYVPARPFFTPAVLRASGGWFNRIKAAFLDGVREASAEPISVGEGE